MKKLGLAVSALFALVLVAVLLFMAVGTVRLGARVEVPDHTVDLPPPGAESVAEGKRLAGVFGCSECHGADLEGADFLEGGPFMQLPASNLTGGRYTDLELERAIRHGVGKDGSTLLIMPSEAFEEMSDSDLGALLAYIGSLPSRDTDLIDRAVGPIGRIVAAFQAPMLQPSRSIVQSAVHASTAGDRGSYYASYCQACHGADLGGRMFTGEEPVWAPNLTAHATGLGAWSSEDFERALRKGMRPDGRALNSAVMPWRGMAGLTDDEVGAIWDYLRELPPVDRPQPTA